MDFTLFAQADQAAFELEKAKRALEAAKAGLDAAKQVWEDALARGEENGVSKAKLKKIVEERVQALFESGLAGGASTKDASKMERIKKPKKNADASAAELDASSTSPGESEAPLDADFAADESDAAQA